MIKKSGAGEFSRKKKPIPLTLLKLLFSLLRLRLHHDNLWSLLCFHPFMDRVHDSSALFSGNRRTDVQCLYVKTTVIRD